MNRDLNRIYLVGYMGCGKSSVGKELAKKMGLQFIDLDTFIENRYHKKVSNLFSEKGEDEFRKIERNTLREVSNFEGVVISTGGGTPCFYNNISLMNETGICVYLKSNIEILLKNLAPGLEKRPLLKGKTPDELKEFISLHLAERETFYNQANYIHHLDISSIQKNINIIASELCSALREYKNRHS